MNRQMKRMQARQERQGRTSEADRQAAASSARRAAVQEKRQRTGARQFLREVRQELKKVDWPTRQELGAYTVVVLVSVTVLTTYVAGLDYGIGRAILNLLSS